MKIINLIENTTGSTACEPEHGLSFYIETKHHRILMDVGASDRFVKNAGLLGIDLAQVDTVILSHGHYDHGGGIPAFLKLNSTAQVYMQKEACGDYYSWPNPQKEPRYIGLAPEVRDSGQVVFLEGACAIDEELSVFPLKDCGMLIPSTNQILKKKEAEEFVQDDFCHEQCLVVREGQTAVLFSGCAHHGILNVMESYRKRYGKDPDAVISGFHLMRKDHYSEEDAKEILQTAHALKKYRTVFYTGHCTGEKPYQVMKKIMGDQLNYVHCGDELHPGGGLETKKHQTKKKGSDYMKWHKVFAWGCVACFIMTMITGYRRK